MTAFSVEETSHLQKVKKNLLTILDSSQAIGYFELVMNENTFKPVRNIPTIDEIEKIVVAGGCITSIIRNDHVNDIDVFVLGSDFDLFHKLFRQKGSQWHVKYFIDPDLDSREDDYKNDHVLAVAFNADSKVQYILTDHSTRKELLEDFDFIHCTASYCNGSFYINRETYDSIVTRRLVPVNKKKKIKRPRLDKFLSRGWSIDEDSLAKDPIMKTAKDRLLERLEQQKQGLNPVPTSHPLLGMLKSKHRLLERLEQEKQPLESEDDSKTLQPVPSRPLSSDSMWQDIAETFSRSVKIKTSN